MKDAEWDNVTELRPLRRALRPPSVEHVDTLDRRELATVSLHLAALQARIAARLLTVSRVAWHHPSAGHRALTRDCDVVYLHRGKIGGLKAGRYVRFPEAGIEAAVRWMPAGEL